MQESTIRNVLTRRGPKVDPVFELTLLLSAFVKLLETPLGLPKPVSDMYEESISAVSHEADDYSKKTIKDQERAADTEKQYFHEISNIREETAMIRSVISQQQQVWKDFSAKLSCCWAGASSITEGDVQEAAGMTQFTVKTTRKLKGF